MATASDEPNDRECTVCMNDFDVPKILPCGHLLCRKCVISWMDTKPDAGCPLCRCLITEVQGQVNPTSVDVADALPTDFMMQALVESARVLAKDPVSCACEDVAADSICVECLDMLCLSCCRAHKKTTVSRHHNVESVSTVTPERLAASRPALCADHGDKPADFFCIDHRRAVCASCCIIKHRECSEVREMNDEIALAENSLKVLTIRLVNGEQRLERAIAQLEARVRDDYLSELEDIKQANIACDRLQKLVEATRDKIKETIGSSHFRAMKSLLSVKGSLCTQLSKLKAHKQVAMRATTVAARPSLIHANEALTDRVNNLDLNADFEVDVSTNPSMNIRGCEELVRRVEKELAMMGQQTKAPEALQLTFHANRGNSILLTHDKKTAERVAADNAVFSMGGVVVSCEALEDNWLYQVRVDKTDRKWKKMLYGVAGLHPSNLSIQQQILEMADSIIIKEFGLLTTAEGNVKEGSVIGMTVDSFNNLHLYFHGKEVGVTAQNVPRPCYAVFDLCNQVVKKAELTETFAVQHGYRTDRFRVVNGCFNQSAPHVTTQHLWIHDAIDDEWIIENL